MSGELIAKLESASEGSRELDYAVFMATAPMEVFSQWSPSDPLTRFTTSIDAALALTERVLLDREVSIAQRRPRHRETCGEWWNVSLFKVRTGVVFGAGPDTVTAKAATPALAICAALLRASAAEGAGHD